MGRKTWESIGRKPLPGRVNVVLSRDTGSAKEEELQIDEEKNTVLLSSLEDAIEYCEGNEFINEVFVIGGGTVYEQAIQFKDRIKNVFHTRVGQKVKGDVKINPGLFDAFEVKEVSKTFSQNGLNFDFVRMINPLLYGQHFKEYNERVFDSQSGEYAYLDLIDSIIKEGKWLLQMLKQKGIKREIEQGQELSLHSVT